MSDLQSRGDSTDELRVHYTEELRAILDRITFAPSCVDMDWTWEIQPIPNAGWFISTTFRRPDTESGEMGTGRGRYEYIGPGTTLSGVVKTAWLLAELIVRHELMEAFLFDGARVFDPHATVAALTQASRMSRGERGKGDVEVTPKEAAPTIPKFLGKYHFLSNFHRAEVMFEGVLFPTVEHAFQAAKSVDPAVREKIRQASDPGVAKKMGRRVALRADWSELRLEVMEQLLRDKFTRHPDLGEKLHATGDADLVEGNTWNDTFWGVCRGQGRNHLGMLLMFIRKELRAAVPVVEPTPRRHAMEPLRSAVQSMREGEHG